MDEFARLLSTEDTTVAGLLLVSLALLIVGLWRDWWYPGKYVKAMEARHKVEIDAVMTDKTKLSLSNEEMRAELGNVKLELERLRVEKEFGWKVPPTRQRART